MSLTNPLGDLEITDPRAMRALAHPVRLAALSYLQQHGPATATQLSDVVGASPSVTSWHLRHLAGFGLVRDWDGGSDARERWWQAAARGFRIALTGTDTDGGAVASGEQEAAYRLLASQMLSSALGQIQTWQHQEEPRLDTAWRELAGTSNTRVDLTREELDTLLHEVENLLAPHVHRRDEGRPREGERSVRFIRFALPAADQEEPA